MNSPLNLHSDLHPHLTEAHLTESHLSEAHLTESQIDDHLIGDLAACPAAHLAACILCSERVTAATEPLSGFQSVTMAWSERRSATLPIPDLPLQPPIWHRPIVSFAVCFSFVLGIAITNATLRFPMETSTPQPVLQETAQPVLLPQAVIHPSAPVETSRVALQRDAQLSADNHMLQAIDAELDTSSDSASELGIVTASEPATRPSAISSVQD